MSNEELKPCPFCGGEADLFSYKGAAKGIRWGIRCGNLSCEIKPAASGYHSIEEAIAAWNKRARLIDCAHAGTTHDGKCIGYQISVQDDSPSAVCIECRKNQYYEDR
jgi:hypothetical protein